MRLRFTGTCDTLKSLFVSIEASGQWVELNENQLQFRHSSGGIMNWFPSTGTINFQGKPEAQKELEEMVRELLATTASPGSAPSEVVGSEHTFDTFNSPSSTRLNDGLLGQTFSDSELVIGLVGAVGTELGKVVELLTSRLPAFGYNCSEIRISQDVIPLIVKDGLSISDEYARIDSLMTAGNEARLRAKDNSVLALGAAAKIGEGRSESEPLRPRNAYIITSLKHPEEVARLREIYTDGFYLICAQQHKRARRNAVLHNFSLPQLCEAHHCGGNSAGGVC